MSTAVVLLHPLGVDHRFWDPVLACLPAGRERMVAPDLLGHGSAPLPAPGAGVEELADAVEALVGATGPVHLVGVSLGGLVAQVVAARSPSLVDRLVLADTVAVYPEPMRAMWRERAGAVRRDGVASIAETTEALWFSPTPDATQPERIARMRELLLATSAEGYARTCEVLADADTTSVAGSIAAPTLIACGRDDAPPFKAAVAWFEENLRDTRTAWLSGAHGTAYEHPQEFAELLTEFLS